MITPEDLNRIPRRKPPQPRPYRATIQFLGATGPNNGQIRPMELLYDQDTPRQDRMVPDLLPNDEPINAFGIPRPMLGQVGTGSGIGKYAVIALIVGVAGVGLYLLFKR